MKHLVNDGFDKLFESIMTDEQPKQKLNESKSTRRDDIDADADDKKERAKKVLARKKDDADSDKDYKLKKAGLKEPSKEKALKKSDSTKPLDEASGTHSIPKASAKRLKQAIAEVGKEHRFIGNRERATESLKSRIQNKSKVSNIEADKEISKFDDSEIAKGKSNAPVKESRRNRKSCKTYIRLQRSLRDYKGSLSSE